MKLDSSFFLCWIGHGKYYVIRDDEWPKRGRGQGHVSYFWSNGTDTRVPQNVLFTFRWMSCTSFSLLPWSIWSHNLSPLDSVSRQHRPVFTRNRYRLDVRPSVRLSVTRWYCIKTAERIVMISSPHDSHAFILVLCISKSFAKFQRGHPRGTAKQRWGIKMWQFSTNNLLYLRNGWR